MALKSKKKEPRGTRKLVTQRLEYLSKSLFEEHWELVKELIGGQHGVYALYNEGELYYVGKSINLKGRVKQHLHDRHLGSWTHFSLYLVRREEHISEIEALLIQIANPKGNKARPKGRSTKDLAKELKQAIKTKQKEDLKNLFCADLPRASSKKVSLKVRMSAADFKGLVVRKRKLRREFKGKQHDAYLFPDGSLEYEGQFYATPTEAAREVRGNAKANGWQFWFIRNKNKDWVPLRDYALSKT
jgi:hypothetical protein